MVTYIDGHKDRFGVEPIGNIPPAELEKAYYEQQESQPKAV